MMFNGLLMYNDSDNSEFTKDSFCVSGSEGEARARSLENSLLAASRAILVAIVLSKAKLFTDQLGQILSALSDTDQALKNKEETVRVQAESLALAEERLAAATRSRNRATGGHCDLTDVSTTTKLQGNREIMKTLQDNLSVIEDLYRECFYETARQDELIARLRASSRAGRRPAQDVALEVENLKEEISNFLHNSTNNDSGVWEAGGELRGVEQQLRRLAAALQADCTCNMMEENMKMKKINETMEITIQDLRQRVSDLEEVLEKKEDSDNIYKGQIKEKDEELQHIKGQLTDLERDSHEQGIACTTLSCQIKQLEGLLNDKTEELINVQRQCVSQETLIIKLKEELEKAKSNARETASVRREVWSLSAEVAAWRRQLGADSRPRSAERRRHLAQHYAEQCTQAEQLRGQLRAARLGGAALCARARAALRAARDGLRALAQHARENEEIITQQELLIRSLREKSSKNISKRSSVIDDEPCCSKYLHRVETRSGDCSFMGTRETPRSGRTSSGLKFGRTGESEPTNEPPPPTPPRRLLRKKPLCVDRRCQWPQVREASVCCTPPETSMSSMIKREFSADSLLERVERTHEALELAHRRWCRHGHEHDDPTA